jgi:hypothetical protein
MAIFWQSLKMPCQRTARPPRFYTPSKDTLCWDVVLEPEQVFRMPRLSTDRPHLVARHKARFSSYVAHLGSARSFGGAPRPFEQGDTVCRSCWKAPPLLNGAYWHAGAVKPPGHRFNKHDPRLQPAKRVHPEIAQQKREDAVSSEGVVADLVAAAEVEAARYASVQS